MAHRKGAMMRKNIILAAVSSLVFVMNCSACGSRGQEVLLIGMQEAESLEQSSPTETVEISRQEAAVEEIWVYVCGAVESPGVVCLSPGSRAADALEEAGGFSADAAEEAVNLAAKVSDGEKIYFPTREEYAVQSQEIEAGGLVNINTADMTQLCTLPGIGESRAADIIAYREAYGGFRECEDIMQVSGIKESLYNKICDKITVK